MQNVTQLEAKCHVIERNRLVNCSKMTRFKCRHPPPLANGKLSVLEVTVSFLTRLSRPVIKLSGLVGLLEMCHLWIER